MDSCWTGHHKSSATRLASAGRSDWVVFPHVSNRRLLKALWNQRELSCCISHPQPLFAFQLYGFEFPCFVIFHLFLLWYGTKFQNLLPCSVLPVLSWGYTDVVCEVHEPLQTLNRLGLIHAALQKSEQAEFSVSLSFINIVCTSVQLNPAWYSSTSESVDSLFFKTANTQYLWAVWLSQWNDGWTGRQLDKNHMRYGASTEILIRIS